MKTDEKCAAEWQELLAKKEDEITALHRQVDWLTQQLRLLRGQPLWLVQREDAGAP